MSRSKVFKFDLMDSWRGRRSYREQYDQITFYCIIYCRIQYVDSVPPVVSGQLHFICFDSCDLEDEDILDVLVYSKTFVFVLGRL